MINIQTFKKFRQVNAKLHAQKREKTTFKWIYHTVKP